TPLRFWLTEYSVRLSYQCYEIPATEIAQMTTTHITDDDRLIGLGNILAGQIRTALDAFEAMEAEGPMPANEMARGERIMAPSQATVAEMLACKPSTLLGFFALELAAKWADGVPLGLVAAES